MANSMFVPISRYPYDMEEIQSIVIGAFDEFGLKTPAVWLDDSHSNGASIKDGFVMIEGAEAADQCWISISDCPLALTGDTGFQILADIKTRGSWVFAGIVAYAICKFAGRCIFNDACELDGQEMYTSETIKGALLKKLAS